MKNKIKLYKEVINILMTDHGKDHMGICHALCEIFLMRRHSLTYDDALQTDLTKFNAIWEEVRSYLRDKTGVMSELAIQKPEFSAYGAYWFDPQDYAIRIQVLEKAIETLKSQGETEDEV